MNFAALDLNLLRVFDAMMQDLSTVRAGERIGLSQPAVSSALGRLRHFTGDELFVRDGNRMLPTPRAQTLSGPLHDALATIEQALADGSPFDAPSAERAFLIGGSDYFSALLMPELARRVVPQAPGITLQMIDCLSDDVPALLSAGKVDLVVDRALDVPDWISSQKLFTSSLVCVLRKDHPATRELAPGDPMPPECFAAIPQVLRSADGSTIGTADAALRKAGLSRRVAMTVPHFQAVALVVAASDLLGNLPVHFARHAARHLPLELYEPPFPSPEMDIFMYWHRRRDREGANLWLRREFQELADAAFPVPRTGGTQSVR